MGNYRSNPSVKEQEPPEFPNEVLLKIFENLSTKDRKSLSFVSKRFRSVDLHRGNRPFRHIRVFLGANKNQIRALCPDEGKVKEKTLKGRRKGWIQHRGRGYRLEIPSDRLFSNDLPTTNELFKNATAEELHIQVRSNCNGKIADDIVEIFNSLLFKRLRITFISRSDDLSEIAYNLITNFTTISQRSKHAIIMWRCAVNQNIQLIRQALLLIPKMERLDISYNIADFNNELFRKGKRWIDDKILKLREVLPDKDPAKILVDGPTFLHLINHSDGMYRRLDVICNGRELLEAFEMICNSSADAKYVYIEVVNSTALEFFDLIREDDEFEMVFYEDHQRDVNHHRRGLIHSCYDDKFTDIFMCKIDENGESSSERARDYLKGDFKALSNKYQY